MNNIWINKFFRIINNVFSKCNSNTSNKYNNIFSKNAPKTNNFGPIYNSNNIVSKSYDLHIKKDFIKANIFETNENKYNPAFPYSYSFLKEYPCTNENSYNIFGISKNIISEKSNVPNKEIKILLSLIPYFIWN